MSKRKKWVGRIYLGRDEDGAQQFEWVGRFATKRERDDAVALRRTERLQAAPLLPACDEYVDRYLRDYERTHKRSSHRAAAEGLRRFRADFTGVRLDVQRAEAKDWANGDGKWKLKGPVPSSSVFPVITLYNHAIDEDDLPLGKNPFRGLGQRTKGRSDAPPPTVEEFEALLAACSALGDYAPQMRAFLRFAAFTLMRPGELFALEWTYVDLAGLRIRKDVRLYRGDVDVPKTGPKLIALTPPARDAIIGLHREGRYVFTSKRGVRLSATTMHGYWGLVRARAGLEFPIYHATKHYGVWFMWTQMGMSPRAIAAQAGWSLRTVNQMLDIYGHGDVGALDEVDAAFAQHAAAVLPKLRAVE